MRLRIALLTLFLPLPLNAETLTLTSLEWPPYASRSQPEQGASVAVVKAAVEAMGHKLKVEFYPWERAVHLAKTQSKYAGYFPEYYFESDDLVLSSSIGTGPLGFAENPTKPVSWSSLNDLKSYKVGVVRGYINTQELDEMIATGAIQGIPVTADNVNLKKVAAKRIPLAVIDKNVFNYLLQSDPEIAKAKASLQMNPKLLEEKQLYVAFGNDETGQKWKKIVDEGLMKIDVEQIMSQYFSN